MRGSVKASSSTASIFSLPSPAKLRKRTKADPDAVDASSIIVGLPNDLGRGGDRPLLTTKVDCHHHLFARLERGLGLDQHSGGRQVDDFAEDLNGTVADRCLKVGGAMLSSSATC